MWHIIPKFSSLTTNMLGHPQFLVRNPGASYLGGSGLRYHQVAVKFSQGHIIEALTKAGGDSDFHQMGVSPRLPG